MTVVFHFQVSIENVSDEKQVYVAFDCIKERPVESDDYHVYADPRLPDLGWRLISSGSC